MACLLLLLSCIALLHQAVGKRMATVKVAVDEEDDAHLDGRLTNQRARVKEGVDEKDDAHVDDHVTKLGTRMKGSFEGEADAHVHLHGTMPRISPICKMKALLYIHGLAERNETVPKKPSPCCCKSKKCRHDSKKQGNLIEHSISDSWHSIPGSYRASLKKKQKLCCKSRPVCDGDYKIDMKDHPRFCSSAKMVLSGFGKSADEDVANCKKFNGNGITSELECFEYKLNNEFTGFSHLLPEFSVGQLLTNLKEGSMVHMIKRTSNALANGNDGSEAFDRNWGTLRANMLIKSYQLNAEEKTTKPLPKFTKESEWEKDADEALSSSYGLKRDKAKTDVKNCFSTKNSASEVFDECLKKAVESMEKVSKLLVVDILEKLWPTTPWGRAASYQWTCPNTLKVLSNCCSMALL